MEEGSLATPEVKKKITYLLGKRSSFVFICFARVLYASRDHTWIDDNLMGYFTVTITRGLVKGYPLYSALLFDYDSFDLKLCFEFSDNMERAVKCSNYCYVIPHENLSFCLLFPDLEDALTFEMGMNGVHDTMQRNSFPPPVLESTDTKKKRRGIFSLFRKNKEESKDVSVSGVMEIRKEDGACFSMLDRLSLQSDMARFHLFSGMETDVFSDSRLAERRVRTEPLWSEVDLPQNKSVDVHVTPVEETVEVREEDEKVDTTVSKAVDTKAEGEVGAKPLEEEGKREISVASESVDLDEEEMMRLVNESVKEAVASHESSPKPSFVSSPVTPSATSSKPSPEESVSQSAIPANPAVLPAENATEERPVTSPQAPQEESVSQSVNEVPSPADTPILLKPLTVSPAEESVSSPANVSASPVPPANPTQITSAVAALEPSEAPAEPLPSSDREASLQPNSDSLEFADLTVSMINSIPLAPALSSSTAGHSIIGHSVMEDLMQPIDDQSAVDQPIVDPLPISQPIIDQPAISQPTVDQPTVNQSPIDQPAINRLPINQPTIDQPAINHSPINQPPTGDSRPSISRRRRRTLQPAIAVEAQTASVRASAESIHEPPHTDSDISVEPSDLLKAIDAIQPTREETTKPSAPSSRPSVLSSLSTESVNEAALEKAMEAAMETVDSAPHLLKPADTPIVSPVRTNRQPSEIRHVSIGVTPAPIQLIRRSGSTRPSDQTPIQPSSSTAIKHISARRVSLQPTPPLPRNVPPPPPLEIRKKRPSLVRPSKEMASSQNASERGLQGRLGPSLNDPLKNNDDSVVFDIPTLSTQANK